MSAKQLTTGEKFYHSKLSTLSYCRDEHFNLCWSSEDKKQHEESEIKRFMVYDPHHTGKFKTSNNHKEFIVVDSKWGGGGTGHGQYDVYPDAWQVFCSPIGDLNTIIKFHQMTNCFCSTIPEVELL